MSRTRNRKLLRRVLLIACCALLALLACACAAASRPADPSRPRANEQPYPVTLAASADRNSRALSTWRTLVNEPATAPVPELQPVTATLRALPQGLVAPLRMPKVSVKEGTEVTEEETRESLRRFIVTAAQLLGIELRDLSLVEIVDAPGGLKRARYQQKPFDLPLRNGFGALEIAFTPDLRVTELSSTAIPDTERLGRAIESVQRQLNAEQAVTSLTSRSITYTDAAGAVQTRTPSTTDNIAARELVVFPVLSASDQAVLELRLAWEISVLGQGTPLMVYVDAVTGEQLKATPTFTIEGGAARSPAR